MPPRRSAEIAPNRPKEAKVGRRSGPSLGVRAPSGRHIGANLFDIDPSSAQLGRHRAEAGRSMAPNWPSSGQSMHIPIKPDPELTPHIEGFEAATDGSE